MDQRHFWLLFVGVFRAALAVVLIRLHTIVALCQTGQTTVQVVGRVITLGVMATAAGIGIQELNQASRLQPQQPIFRQQTNVVPAPPPGPIIKGGKKGGKKMSVRPSFDCAKTQAPVELLICRDSRLVATLDVERVSAYQRALSRAPQDGRRTVAQAHLAWFKNYSRTCTRATNDQDRATCVANSLSSHTAELNGQR